MVYDDDDVFDGKVGRRVVPEKVEIWRQPVFIWTEYWERERESGRRL